MVLVRPLLGRDRTAVALARYSSIALAAFIVVAPSCSTSWSCAVFISSTLLPVRMVPSSTRTTMTTPR